MTFDAYHNCIYMPTSKKYNFISLIYNTKTLTDYRTSMLPMGFWLVDRRALGKSVLSSDTFGIIPHRNSRPFPKVNDARNGQCGKSKVQRDGVI